MPLHKVLILDVSPGTSLVRGGAQGLKGVILKAGTDQATLTIYDNGAGVASGPIKEELVAPANANEGWIRDMSDAVILNGVTAVLTGTSAKAKIHLSADKI